MNYHPTLAGAAALAATTFYPMNPKGPDQHISSGIGNYRFEMPAMIAIRGNHSFGIPQHTRQSERDIEFEFVDLAKKWKEDTDFHSSLSEKVMHPAYQRIMAMGKTALPFILRDLRETSDHWFYALEFIAGKEGEQVAIGADTIPDAKSAWLEWGYQNGYI